MELSQTMNLVEADPIAAIVPGARPHGKLTAGELRGDNFSDLTNTIIGGAVANVEYLIVDVVARSFQCAANGSADIHYVDQRAPGSAVAGHRYLL